MTFYKSENKRTEKQSGAANPRLQDEEVGNSPRLSGPLDGVTVVSIEQAVAAPLATRHLADLGARVIKIERPFVGDFAREYDSSVRGTSSHFAWVNRTKESLSLDLKHPAAADIVGGLLRAADVFVLNLAPGSIDRLGLAPSLMQLEFPELVICRISGYGATGPYASKKAYDLLIQAEAGLLSVTGTHDQPAKVGIPVADIAAGMYAFSGILAALYERSRTGLGNVIEVSMFESLVEWMGYPALFTRYGGTPPARTGMHHATIVPYGPYRTNDGEVVLLAVQTADEWQRFCTTVLQRPELAGDQHFATNDARFRNREELERVIVNVLINLSSTDLISRLDSANLASARFNDIEGLLNHPLLDALGRWKNVDSSIGPILNTAPPINFPAYDPVMGPIPDLGQHTDAILGSLGLSPRDIASLRASGAI
jgi:itaconate CoA-transferase